MSPVGTMKPGWSGVVELPVSFGGWLLIGEVVELATKVSVSVIVAVVIVVAVIVWMGISVIMVTPSVSLLGARNRS